MPSLEDVADVEGFSGAVVRRLARRMPEDEIQEGIAEGVALLYELHETWDPERCASFYSYCMTYLEMRLISWWRRDSRQRVLAHRNGKGYVYHGRVSLDEPGGALADDDEGKAKQDRALVTVDSHRRGD